MARVTLYGVSESDEERIFHKTIQLDDQLARKISGPEKQKILKAILKENFPSMTIRISQVGIQIIYDHTPTNDTSFYMDAS